MKKMIPYEKLSKKRQRALNAEKRGSWYGVNPVTRKKESAKVYNRKKARNWRDDSMSVPFAVYWGSVVSGELPSTSVRNAFTSA